MNEVQNHSGVEPLGRAVLVEYYEPEVKTSRIIIPENVKDRTVLVEQRATVIAVGPVAWPNEPPRAVPGDRVLIAKFSGYALTGPADGRRYRIVNDADVFARITHDEGFKTTGDQK
jgi:co-chaperonin GroES (HSP10)